MWRNSLDHSRRVLGSEWERARTSRRSWIRDEHPLFLGLFGFFNLLFGCDSNANTFLLNGFIETKKNLHLATH